MVLGILHSNFIKSLCLKYNVIESLFKLINRFVQILNQKSQNSLNNKNKFLLILVGYSTEIK